MTLGEQQQLNVYRAEVARGLVHTQEWVDRMRRLESNFDANRALYRCTACNHRALGAEFSASEHHSIHSICPNCGRWNTARLA